MESRKDLLRKQIIEALRDNDNDLYALLKSQWAHRFGVESLDELNNLDLKQLNQNLTNVETQKIRQLQEDSMESDKSIPIKDNHNLEEEIKTTEFESIKDVNDESFKTKPNEIVDKIIYENKAIGTIKENVNQPIVQALIPLPPKPKYSYLKKWLLRR